MAQAVAAAISEINTTPQNQTTDSQHPQSQQTNPGKTTTDHQLSATIHPTA